VDITSANAVLTISPRTAGLVGVGAFTVEGFASDDAFMSETVDSAEAIMGVDGKMSVGYTPYIVKQTITLQADSPSATLFETILSAQNTLRQPMIVDAVLALPSIQKSYIFTKGALTRVTPFAAGKKVLQPQQFELSWEVVSAVPLAA
jgi:hypothetical protein